MIEIDEHFILTRIARAKESIEEAKLLLENEHYLTVVNRLYYSVFYIVCACLAKHGIISKTHSGTKINFTNFL